MSEKSKAIKLLSPNGFDQAFTKLLNDPFYPTQESVYNELENQYKTFFGTNRYSSFESYKKARSRRLARSNH